MTDPGPQDATDGLPMEAATPVAIDPPRLEILVCPGTQGPRPVNRAAGERISRAARLAYPIRDGIPIMLPDEARPLDDA